MTTPTAILDAAIAARLHMARYFVAVELAERAFAEADDDATVKRLIELGGAALATLATKLSSGVITKRVFIARAIAALFPQAQTAANLGAARYGSVSDLNTDAYEAQFDTWADRLGGFADTITSGGFSSAQLGQFALGSAGVLWPIFLRASGDGAQAAGLTVAHFHLAEDAAHCDGCLEREAGSPYPIDEIPSWPGDGSTECGPGDRCWVTFSSGETEE